MIVVDTNVIISFWAESNKSEIAYELLRKDTEWVAPLLWRSEFRNAMALYLRKEIYDLPTIYQIIGEAEGLMDSSGFEINSTQVMQRVRNSNCSAYDCEFIALAADLEVPLITFDSQLCKEFPEIAAKPYEYLNPS